MGIGKNLRAYREKRGFTQEALSERIGVTSSAIGNYERDVSHPREDILYKLLEVLECEPNELFEGLYTKKTDDGNCRHMDKYQRLDEVGKNRVDICTELELERCCRCAPMAETNGGEREVLIAARGNGAPHIVKMKKGKSSIFDAPDFRGGGK